MRDDNNDGGFYVDDLWCVLRIDVLPHKASVGFLQNKAIEGVSQNKANAEIFCRKKQQRIFCRTKPMRDSRDVSMKHTLTENKVDFLGNKPNGVFSFVFYNVPSRPACLPQFQPL